MGFHLSRPPSAQGCSLAYNLRAGASRGLRLDRVVEIGLPGFVPREAAPAAPKGFDNSFRGT